ncbi:MAG: hypothetical protein WBH47_18305 [Streptosporangiaceae bacterium]
MLDPVSPERAEFARNADHASWTDGLMVRPSSAQIIRFGLEAAERWIIIAA